MDAPNDLLAASCGHIAARGFAQPGGTAALRGCSERDDWEMFSVRLVAHIEIDTYAGPSTNQGVRSGTRRSSGPSRTRFERRASLHITERCLVRTFSHPGPHLHLVSRSREARNSRIRGEPRNPRHERTVSQGAVPPDGRVFPRHLMPICTEVCGGSTFRRDRPAGCKPRAPGPTVLGPGLSTRSLSLLTGSVLSNPVVNSRENFSLSL